MFIHLSLSLIPLLIHLTKPLKLILIPSYKIINRRVIRYLINIIILLILVSSLQNILDFLATIGLATAEIVEAALDEELVEVHFEGCLLEDSLLDRRVGDEAQDEHLLLLPDTMCTVLCL